MWYLRTDRGRQWWEHDDSPSVVDEDMLATSERFFKCRLEQRHSSDTPVRLLAAHGLLHSRGKVEEQSVPTTDDVDDVLIRGMGYYSTLQMDDGHWPGDYGGPLFLMPGLVIACYATSTDLGAARVAEMKRYMYNQQREDGGWGMHIEKESTMFGTVLQYVSLRLLGEQLDDNPRLQKAQAWILGNGGAVGVPSWAKFYLCVLGVYEWEGINPLTPEMWLLPYTLPVHPARMWCHCRQVYLPMSHIYALRRTVPQNPLTHRLRQELYITDYKDIHWDAMRNNVCPKDEYVKRPAFQKYIWDFLSLYEKYPFQSLRSRALKETIANIQSEDENTDYICIGPVNKVLNMMCRFFDDPDGVAFKRHQERLLDYLWLAEDGMKMQGYNGCQLWDTAFSAQAIAATGSLSKNFTPTLQRAYHYLDITQVRENVPSMARFYKHISKGAWPFSTRDHGWPISDCTAEGLKAELVIISSLGETNLRSERIAPERLYDCINVILSFFNEKSGGFATYELTRGPEWLELLNPSEVFSPIMIDYTWVECTSACITALSGFQKSFPDHRKNEIERVIRRATDCVKRLQRSDGSWYGNWGVCFTYGGWFGITALVETGHTLQNSDHLRKACEFFVSKQRSDGSWGEDYRSCQDKVYTEAKEGQIVNTSWVLLSLCLAQWPETSVMDRGAHFLISKQEENGDWPQQVISGVFNSNCMITYPNYRSIFPIWALGVYRRMVLGRT